MIYELLQTTSEDKGEIESLIALAFGNQRHKRLINQLRQNCTPYELGCFVAKQEGSIIGSIQYYLAKAETGEIFPCLGPLAVLPDIRGKGVGKALIEASLEKLKQAEHRGVLIIGDSGYYAPFGFSPDVVARLDLGGSVAPLAFMGLEWIPDSLSQASGIISFIENPNE